MITLLMISYGVILLTVTVWTLKMLRSHRHFRTVIQHPSLTRHITA
ncbi:MAG: hypothetical protein JXA18_13425 [Chitinispirillaceae bacterium]|nr:hypothetical protein [Chitinispirillaceae bacterium]